MENQLDSVTEKPIRPPQPQGLACDWPKHNKHSRNISSVHGFLRLSVRNLTSNKFAMNADQNNTLDLCERRFEQLGNGGFMSQSSTESRYVKGKATGTPLGSSSVKGAMSRYFHSFF